MECGGERGHAGPLVGIDPLPKARPLLLPDKLRGDVITRRRRSPMSSYNGRVHERDVGVYDNKPGAL